MPKDDTIHAASTLIGRTAAPIGVVFAIALAVLLVSGGDRTPHVKPGNLASIRGGCDPGTRGTATNGSGVENRVAVTFDDGPSASTGPVLRALRRAGARATFFVVGSQVEGREGMLRRMMRDGHEIANHSTMHAPLPDEDDLAAASAAIEGATGFRPCHFRPPGGEVSDELVQRADNLGMSIVLWSVDPGDWQAQEPAEILDGVTSVVEPGSIVLLHDGGGDRAMTAQIVAPLIERLRRSGLEPVTVTKLLGGGFTIGNASQ